MSKLVIPSDPVNNPVHQIYFQNAATGMPVNTGDVLTANVYLDPNNPPTELLLSWYDPSTGWGHRVYLGANSIGVTAPNPYIGDWGVDGTISRRKIGDSLPPLGQWVRIEVPASLIGLEGKTVTGFCFTLLKGSGAFDCLGKRSGDVIWADEVAQIPDNSQTRLTYAESGVETWETLNGLTSPLPNPLPISGQYAFRTKNTLGDNPQVTHMIHFQTPSNPLKINGGDSLVTYVYLDPINAPSELMLQWYDGTWEHRAYWGSNIIGPCSGGCNGGWGIDGSVAHRNISDSLPPLGQWVRLEVPAYLVGLEGKSITGFSLTLNKGRGAFDRLGKTTTDIVWKDDDLSQTQLSNGWNYLYSTSDIKPISGDVAFDTGIVTGESHMYFENSTQTMSVNTGDSLFAYVYLDPVKKPEQLILQWKAANWLQRVYWGEQKIHLTGWGTEGTKAMRYMGPLPPAGQWVRMEVPASRLGLEGVTVNGFSLSLFSGAGGGRAAFDRIGKCRTAHLDY